MPGDSGVSRSSSHRARRATAWVKRRSHAIRSYHCDRASGSRVRVAAARRAAARGRVRLRDRRRRRRRARACRRSAARRTCGGWRRRSRRAGIEQLRTNGSCPARDSCARPIGRRMTTSILGADTAVVVDGEILGKPRDDEDAAAMLRRLSGRRHEVLTGVSLRRGAGEVGRRRHDRGLVRVAARRGRRLVRRERGGARQGRGLRDSGPGVAVHSANRGFVLERRRAAGGGGRRAVGAVAVRLCILIGPAVGLF